MQEFKVNEIVIFLKIDFELNFLIHYNDYNHVSNLKII